ncbi:MAG: molybdate ABC transporter substrate-binding protein [Myxococcota bacterium]
MRAVAVSLFLMGVVACQAQPSDRRTLVVFAASSLTEAFQQIAGDFESAHPGVEVRLSFAGSQSLRTQIENGAGADVFASANPKHMKRLRADGLVESQRVFAMNSLVLVVPRDNPAGLQRFEDLPRAERIVLAGPEVPAGHYTERVLQRQAQAEESFDDAVMKRVVSRENDVRATLQKVVLGEADAAVVYTTDAATVADEIRTIEISNAFNVRARYPVARLSGSRQAELADRFVSWLTGPSGARRLAEHGFQPSSGGMHSSRH